MADDWWDRLYDDAGEQQERTPPAAAPLPLAPADATDLPPWRQAATAVKEQPAEPVGYVVLLPDDPEPEAEPQHWDFTWLRRWLRPWHTLIGATLAVIPLHPAGYSLTTGWALTLHNARDFGITGAYLLAAGGIALAVLIDHRRETWWARALLVAAVIGSTGALSWYDPVTFLTGVRP